MPSEVIQTENHISVESKDIIEKIETKENDSREVINESEKQINDESEESRVSENENKENEKPICEDNESLKKRAEDLLIDGKRYLLIKDFQAAADVLSEACSLYGTVYGEMAKECAEPYFKYGCALLELGKEQISPVGLEEKNNDDDSTQEESLTEMDKNDVTNEDEKSNNLKTEEKSAEEEKNADVKENNSVKNDEISADEVNISVDKEMTADEENKLSEEEMSTEEPNQNEEDSENDLQLAWEMLDLAKVIYKNQNTEESKHKLAEVLMKCGEVSIEDEQFTTAIEDIKEALQIRRLILPEDSRIIAETLFQLAIAEELGGSGKLAIDCLTEAAAVLHLRIKNLENSTNDNDMAFKEVAEVKAIIPEIQDKIIDIKERKKVAVSALLAAVSVTNEATTNGGESSSTKQVSDIGHLVRKRPKQDETDGTPNKVPKLEESTVVKK